MYSQIQNIRPDSTLRNISNWDGYLNMHLDQADLPFRTSSDFIINDDYYNLVLASELPPAGKFVDQSIAFCKAFCKLLLNHEIIKSDLTRGLSSFDPSVIFEGSEEHYTVSIEKLATHFVGSGWISSSDKVKVISQYRSFITKLRDGPVPDYEDWIHFLSSHYKVQCRPELYQLDKYSCLCLPLLIEMSTPFVVPLASLEYGAKTFQSCLRSLQASNQTIPHFSSLYRNPKSISCVVRLLGRGTDLLTDKKFSVWNFVKGSRAKRTTLLGK